MIHSAFLNPMGFFGRKSMTTGAWKAEIWFVKYFHFKNYGLWFVPIRNSPLLLSQYPTPKNVEQNISLE